MVFDAAEMGLDGIRCPPLAFVMAGRPRLRIRMLQAMLYCSWCVVGARSPVRMLRVPLRPLRVLLSDVVAFDEPVFGTASMCLVFRWPREGRSPKTRLHVCLPMLAGCLCDLHVNVAQIP